MPSRDPRTRAVAAAALGAALAACGGPTPEAVLDAAVVPGADVLVRVEVHALRSAAVFAEARDEEAPAPAEPPADGAEAPETDGERFLEITGLSPEDVVSLVLSADLDPLDVAPGAESPDLAAIPSAAALLLAQPLSLESLERSILEATGGTSSPSVTRLEVAGVPALRVETAGEDASVAFLSVVAGDTTLLAAPSQQSLAGALTRAAAGETAAVAPSLEGLLAALPPGAQARAGFVVPQKFRDGLKTRLAEPPPEMAMFAGFAAPFEDLQSLSLGVEAAERLTVILGGDLGADQPAQQASAILGGLLGPMARSALASALDRLVSEMNDRLEVAATGASVEITLRLTGGDLRALRSRAQAEAAARAPAE